MPYDQLELSLHKKTFADAETAQGLTVCTPVFRVNGKPLFRQDGYTVDTLGVLIRGADEGEFDLLTCSCGVAGCAGFHDPVEVRRLVAPSGETVVQWHVPLCGYDRCIAESWGPGPWVFQFESAQLARAIAQLEAGLLEAEREHGVIEYTPCEPLSEYFAPTPPLSEVLARGRKQQANDLRYRQLFQDSFADLADLSLHLVLSSSQDCQHFYLSVKQLGWALLSDADLPCELETDEDFEAAQALFSQTSAQLRQNPLQVALGLSAEQRSAYAHCYDPCSMKWDMSIQFPELTEEQASCLVVELSPEPA